MARVLVIAAVMLASVLLARGQEIEHKREKRAIWNFAWMIWKVVRINPAEYSGYGCNCLSTGHGKPVDDVDRCCQAHTKCYEQVYKMSCSPHWDPYYFSIRGKAIRCTRGGPPCDVHTCRCDKAAVECFARSHFNRRYRNFNRKRYCKKEDD
uniref:Phospholipase A2 n=1 Tax=Petromyzon marinus TaxID=7757 RepID=A0AAJ7THM3_PETMA|nr:phospholipase A2 A2-actitoxin-Cgg2a-like [Petromyzon marinus]